MHTQKNKEKYFNYAKVFFVSLFFSFILITISAIWFEDEQSSKFKVLAVCIFLLPILIVGIFGLIVNYAASNEIGVIVIGKTAKIYNSVLVVLYFVIQILLIGA